MKFSTIFAVAASAGLAAAEVGGILICNGADATGECYYSVYEMNTCYNVSAPLYQNASTFAPDGDAFTCNPYIMPCGTICYSPEGCTMGPVSFDYEHKFNLSAVGWNHYISSFNCFLNETST